MGRAKLWNPKFAQLFCIEAMLQFGLYLTRPLVAGYAVSLGASLTLAGFLAGLLAAAALAARPVSGIAADRLGKRTCSPCPAGFSRYRLWGAPCSGRFRS